MAAIAAAQPPAGSSGGLTVLVTGATSFLGSHCINLLLQEGYQVRGSVRSLTSEKAAAVRQCFERFAGALELVECDLTKKEGWGAACHGCTYVLHVASPVEATSFCKDPMGRRLKEDKEVQKVIDGAVGGTVLVVDAAKEAGVKRLVLTSSVSSMLPAGWIESPFPYPNVPGAVDLEKALAKPITEETWTEEKLVQGYLLAKTQAEKAAWESAKGSAMELVSINPPYVMGPQLHRLLWSDSLVMVDMVMRQPPDGKHSLPAIPDTLLPTVDVRDVATAHLRAMTQPEAAGQRFYVGSEVLRFTAISDVLTAEFRPMGYNTLTARLPRCVAGLLGLCDPLMHRMHTIWGKYPKFCNDKVCQQLGLEFRDARVMLVDTVLASVATGRYERKLGFKTEKPEYQEKNGEYLVLAARA